MSKLDIEQPVIAIFRLRTGFENQELLCCLLAQQAIFEPKLIVCDFDLLYSWKANRVEVSAQGFFLVVPKDYAMLFEETFQGILDFRFWIFD
jgi:hypothetical protein